MRVRTSGAAGERSIIKCLVSAAGWRESAAVGWGARGERTMRSELEETAQHLAGEGREITPPTRARRRSASDWQRSASRTRARCAAPTVRYCSRRPGSATCQRRDPVRRDDPANPSPAARRSSLSYSTATSSPALKSTPASSRLAGCPGETVTEGLDGLRERLRGIQPGLAPGSPSGGQ